MIFSYIRRLGTFFGVQNFVFQFYLFFFFLGGGGGGGVRKINIFWGVKNFVDIFWGSSQIGLYLGVISMHFMVFS